VQGNNYVLLPIDLRLKRRIWIIPYYLNGRSTTSILDGEVGVQRRDEERAVAVATS